MASVVRDRNIRLIPDAFEAVGTSLGEAAAGNTDAIFSLSQGIGKIAPAGYLGKTTFSRPDIDAELNIINEFKNKPVFIGEGSGNSIAIVQPINNFDKHVIQLENVVDTTNSNQMSALARERSDLRSIDTRSLTTGQKGDLGEARTALTMQKAGYQELPARLPRNNGFDGVWVKYNGDGNVMDIVISETKFSSSGKASLANTKTMGKQLSDRWIRENIDKMLDSNDLNVVETGFVLFENRSKIKRKAALVTPDGNQKFNKIKIPEK